ncbi:MAG: formate dehydrogenase subunit delta [Steroidobacteraceae bacterium]
MHSLVKMANDIGHFFASEPKRADAVAGIANHIQRSWDPRMLRQIIAHLKSGGAGLEDLPREAVGLLKLPAAEGHAGAQTLSAAATASANTGGNDAGGASSR